MSRSERIFLWLLLCVACAALVRGVAPAPAGASPSGSAVVEARIAVCSVVRITDELMDGDRYKPARIELEERLREELLRPVTERAQRLQERAEGLNRDDPALRELAEQHRALQREAQRISGEIVQRIEQKVAEQLAECYQMVRASAVAVAEERGFNYVLASTDQDEKMRSETVMRLMRDMLSRPVILAPASVDITDEVRDDLKLR